MKRLLTPLALVFCAAALVLAGCESPAGDTSPEDTAAPLGAEAQSALAALPADTRFLSVADMQALRRGGQALPALGETAGETGARLADFFDATDFDPAKDVRKVYVAASSGMGSDTTSSTEGASPQMAVAADFDRARFQEQLASEAWSNRFEQETYRGQTIYRRTGSGYADTASAFTLTADGLIFLSTPAGVRQMLDRLETGSGSAAENDRLMRLADRVRGRGSTWFVARDVPDFSDDKDGSSASNNASDGAQRFQRLQQVVQDAAGAVSLTNGTANGEFFLYTQQSAAPGDLREVLEGVVSAAGRSDSLSEQKRRALDSIEIEETGDQAVRVAFSLPMEKGDG